VAIDWKEATGMTRGPFYNHFSSKEELMADSIKHGLRKTLQHLGASDSSPEGKANYIDSYLSTAHRDAPGRGCLMAAPGSEIRQTPQVRAAFATQLKAIIEKLAPHFPWRSKRSAGGDSIRALSSMVGGLILARAVDDEAFSTEILSGWWYWFCRANGRSKV
jgi:TetR/AcrR family transcriptional repressor of nem operon